MKTYMEAFAARRPFEMEYRLHRHDGEWRWISDHGAPYYREDGAFAGYIGSCMDVTDRVEGNLYKEQAQRDSLTGVFSRSYLLSQIQRYSKQAQSEGIKFTLAMLDIDRFKQVNDVYGHVSGDHVLRDFSRLLAQESRETDLISRNGGEEFSVILARCDLDSAIHIAERFREKVEQAEFFSEDHQIIRITVSIGVANYPVTAENAENLVLTADKALYAAKQSGRNRVCVAEPLLRPEPIA